MRGKLTTVLNNPVDSIRYIYRHTLQSSVLRIKRRAGILSYHPEFDESLGDFEDPSSKGYRETKLDQNRSRPLDARQYDPDAWESFTLKVDGDRVDCNFNPNPDAGSESTICLLPYRGTTVQRPWHLKENGNVASEWFDRLVEQGCSLLVVEGKWLDDLPEAAELVKRGYDPFTRVKRRIDAAVTHILDRQSHRSVDIVGIGSSRYAYSVLSATADNPDIDGVAVLQPVIWWPSMHEFSGVNYANAIIQETSLYDEVEQLPPRPVLIQTGYMDDRIGQQNNETYSRRLSAAYTDQGVADRFQHTTLGIPGHSGYVPPAAFEDLAAWMKQHDFAVEPGN